MFRGVTAPCVGIALVSAALGLSVNAVRDRDRIELGRAYFDVAPVEPAPGPRVPTGVPERRDREAAARLAGRAAAEFTVLDADRARALLGTGGLAAGDVVFVDARDAAHFRAGHVPGALDLDYYNLRADIEPELPWLREVPWLVVYCESDECEDGYLLCRALRDEYGIAPARILLYLGGMREWRERGFPVAEGAGLR